MNPAHHLANIHRHGGIMSEQYPPELVERAEEVAAVNTRTALANLVAALDTVQADPRHEGVWIIAQMHQGPYTGPTYTDALAAARRALATPPADLAPVSGEVELRLIARALRTRMATACDWTKAGKDQDHVKVRTVDWHVLMEIGERAATALRSAHHD